MGKSQIIVSSLDLPGLVRQAAFVDGPKTDQSFDRPQLDSDYVPPSNDIERKLAGFWQDLLGVTQVGIDDSFFDLGGHSLIAVRLFAMVKKAYSIDFPISVLFEAPTIRRCAALLSAQGVPADAGAAPAAMANLLPVALPIWCRCIRVKGAETAVLSGGGDVRQCLEPAPSCPPAGHRPAILWLAGARPLWRCRTPFGPETGRRRLYRRGQGDPAAWPLYAGRLFGGWYHRAGNCPPTDGGRRGSGRIGHAGHAPAGAQAPVPGRPDGDPAAGNAGRWHCLSFRWLARRIRWEFDKRKPKADTATDAPQFHNAAIEAAFLAAVRSYDLQHWDGPLALFRPALVGKWQVGPARWVSSERAYVTHDNDWTGHAPRIEVFEVPGNHDSMVLEPNVRVLAARMKRVIEAAERAQPATAPWAMAKAAE